MPTYCEHCHQRMPEQLNPPSVEWNDTGGYTDGTDQARPYIDRLKSQGVMYRTRQMSAERITLGETSAWPLAHEQPGTASE